MAVSKLTPASNANDFNLNITGFYTKINLNKEYSSGSYSLTSGNNDTSLDIYAFNSDGSSAGVTATKSFTATKGFNKLVVVGGQAGDVLSFAFKTTYPTETAGVETGVPPIPTAIDPTSLATVDATATLSGYNFATGMNVSFIGTDAVARAAKTTTVGSSTSAIVTRPDVMPVNKAPYSISIEYAGVTPPSGSTAGVLTNAVTAGAGPSWTTGASLTTYTKNVAYTTTLVATDPDPAGSIVSYTVVSGALPTGLTLVSSTGVISGTPTSSSPATFTVRATNQDGDYLDRIFTLSNVGPTWVTTAGAIDTGVASDAYTFTLVATDDSGVAPTYELAAGSSLPTGLSLSSSGVISGTIGASAVGTTFTVLATDANGSSASRTFSITVATPGVWSTVGTAATAYEATDAFGGLYNGFLYVGGGQKNGTPNTYPVTWQKVDLGTGVATILADAPQQRDEMGSIWVGNKHIVINGYNQNGSAGTYNTPMIYNDATNTWSIGTAAPYGITGLSHNTTDGTNLYSINNIDANMYRYNVAANTWTTLASRDNSRCAGGRRMVYRASSNTIYDIEYIESSAIYGTKTYNVTTNSWSYSTKTIPRLYDGPWTSSDNYQMGVDLDHTGDNIYMYSYDMGYSKTSPARADGGTPDRILKYNIPTDTWTMTAYTDCGQCGNGTGRSGRSYYSWGGAYVTTGGVRELKKTLRTTIL